VEAYLLVHPDCQNLGLMSGCSGAAERVEVAVVGAVAARATAAAEREVRLRVVDLEWQEQE
jgi:hypothetical protein